LSAHLDSLRGLSSQRAATLVARLAALQQRIVLAESCTGGLVAATLTEIPGVSQWLCGSAVTYQEATKQAWLKVSAEKLRRFTAVSEEVTQAMVQGVLAQTSVADVGMAVTGHLGPDAPSSIDGLVFVSFLRRGQAASDVVMQQLRLQQSGRIARQIEATIAVLDLAITQLQPASD